MKRISIRDDVLEVQYDGALTYAERTSVLEEVHAVIRREGIERVLLDFTGAWAAKNSHEGSVDQFIARLEALGFQGTSIAYLNAPAEHSEPVLLLSESVGLRVGRFYCRRSALGWLAETTSA
jgi:hypothetical protein